MSRLHAARAFARKELRQTWRDPHLVFLLLALPVVQLGLYGYAVDFEVDRLPTVLCDLDQTPTSRELAARFFASDRFRKVAETLDPDQASRALERGEAVAALLFPAGLETRLRRGRPAEVQVLADGTNPVRARVLVTSAEQFFAAQAAGLALERGRRAGTGPVRGPPAASVRLETRVLYNPGLESPLYMVPGALASVLLFSIVQLTAMGVARERERGTLEQVLVTPVDYPTLVIGKTVSPGLVGLLNIGILLVVGGYLFEVPVRGSFAAVLVASVLYLAAILGTGLFLGSASRTQQQAILSSIFFNVPAFLLSGYVSPIETMPPVLQALSYLDPMRHYLEILRGCMLRGAGFSDFAPQILALAACALAVFLLGGWHYRRRLARGA
jgi:ABC-2 type transport system permease protein